MSKEKGTFRVEQSHFKNLHANYSSLVNRLMENVELGLYIGNNLPTTDHDAFAKVMVDLLTVHGRVVPFVNHMIDVPRGAV